jgi:MOSC domain-containing protein YiiM
MKFKILSLNIGQVGTLKDGRNDVQSSFLKEGIQHSVVSQDGLEGDQQADLKDHGGHDKALCVFSAHHIPSYETFLGKTITIPGFGENLTIEQADEENVFIGDIFSCGEVKVQVSQPRKPCSKAGLFHHKNSLVKFMMQNGRTGFYLRVLNGGLLQKGDEFTLVESDKLFSIADCNDLMFRRNKDQDDLKMLIGHPELSIAWKNELGHILI